MIVTVTPNPSLDRTLELAALEPGEVNRATASRVDPGGKGVNVARALVANGHRVRAVVPLGGHEGEQLAASLRDAGLDVYCVRIAEAVRTNISLVEPDGRVTKINAAGPHLRDDEVAALEEATIACLDGATWVAASGSLPPGVPGDFYARLAADVHEVGARIAVDTSGEPLAVSLAGRPDLIKPNAEELAAVADRDLSTLGEVVAAADELRGRGAVAVLVSLGADGAVLVDEAGRWHAMTPPMQPRSNVGAGDAALAGYLAAGGAGPDSLRAAVAYGAAAVRLPGSAMPGPDDLRYEDVRVTEIDPTRRLGS